MTSAVNFQGLSTGLPTDQLITAALAQDQARLDQMTAKQTKNSQKNALLSTMRMNVQALNTSISALGSAFDGRTVTSSDSNGTYVTATASGSATGTYDLKVDQIATGARLVSLSNVGSTDANLGGTLSENGTYDYTITNKDGKQTTISLDPTKNTAAGLRDAINAKSSDAGVNATLIQSKAGQYTLVVASNDTGLGTANTNNDSIFIQGNAGNAFGFSTSGSQSLEKAQNAKFTLNGLSMERTSNTVSDAVDGVSFALKSGDGGKTTTTLTISVDQSGITSAMNGVVSKYNAIQTLYKANSAQGGAFAGDTSIRNLVSQTHSALMGTPAGLSSGNSFQSLAFLGLKTNGDGSMSLDSASLQNSLNSDVSGASNLVNKLGVAFQTFTNNYAGYGSGSIVDIQRNITNQNSQLARRITDAQAHLDKQKATLQTQYATLESTVGQLQAMGQSLTGLR